MRILPGSLLSILNRSRAEGGHLPCRKHSDGERPVELSPGRLITDPDEAEALGLTVDARRLRGRP